MIEHELDRNEGLDPGEAAALQTLLTAPQLTDGDRESLRARIAAAAELPLARRRRALPSRRAVAIRWLRPALPLAAAAVLFLVLFRSAPPGSPENGALTAAESALLADVSDAEFARLVSGAADAEALLLIAVGDD